MKNISKLMKQTRKNRMRIKNICLSSNTLFQVPFTFEQIDNYKGISQYYTCDCFFQVLSLLGLRHYYISKRDSKKIYNLSSKGVEINDAARYLSTIFGTMIETKHINPLRLSEISKNPINRNDEKIIFQSLISEMKLENGYATLVCGLLYNTTTKMKYGHFFVIHKQNDTIYYYDQSSRRHTTDLNKLFKFKRFLGFCPYYNSKNSKACLIRNKITQKIPISLNN
jgi:hypothetical protein